MKSTPRRGYVTSRRFQGFALRTESRVRTLRSRISAVEATVDPLVDHVAHVERELLDHDQRLMRLERGRRRRPARSART
jgi:hypothetical protein